jgi:hypothetical protein
MSLSGPSLDLIAPIRPLQLCADGGYQLRLGVLGVPLIMVPDNDLINALPKVPLHTCPLSLILLILQLEPLLHINGDVKLK